MTTPSKVADRKWRIYYGDDSTYSDRDGSPFDAPQTNVQAVVTEMPGSPTGKRVNLRQDHFYWSKINGWVGCDWSGMWDYWMNYKGPKAVIFGRSLSDSEFQRINKRAFDEGLG